MEKQQTFEAFVTERFGGILRAGSHVKNGKACVVEAWNLYQGHTWSDDPRIAGCFDLRPLNDINVSDALRTSWMLRLATAYAGSCMWPAPRQIAVVEHLCLLTVQRLVSLLPGLSGRLALTGQAAARAALEVAEAALAAWAAGEAARAAGEAAWAAASAAASVAAGVARAAGAGRAARETIFVIACQLWLEAAQEREP